MRFIVAPALLWLASAAPAAADEAIDPLSLTQVYRKGQTLAFDTRLSVQDLLERDLLSTNDWKNCRERKIEWTFKLTLNVSKKPTPAGVCFEGTLSDLSGTWLDKTPDDDKRPDVDVAFSPPEAPGPKNAKPAAGWQGLFASWSGHAFGFTAGPRGGVSKIEGFDKPSAKRFGLLIADPGKGALAGDLACWFSDEAWKAILTGIFPEVPAPRGSRKGPAPFLAANLSYPFPWGTPFQEKPPASVQVTLLTATQEEGTLVKGGFTKGKIDQTLQFIGQPGFHSLGTEQKGEILWVHGEDGLKKAEIAWEIHDRWDNYRPSAKADRFERKAAATIKIERRQEEGDRRKETEGRDQEKK